MRELEKTLMEIESAIKDHERRGNTHTQSVLQIAHEIISVCAKYARTLPELEEILGNGGWIPVERRLPDESDGLVLIQVNGKPKENITLYNALELACYIAEGNEGWILEEYPEWENPDVIAWHPLPDRYQPEKTTQRPEWKDRMLHTFLGGHEKKK